MLSDRAITGSSPLWTEIGDVFGRESGGTSTSNGAGNEDSSAIGGRRRGGGGRAGYQTHRR